MPDNSLRRGSLALYKGRPARVAHRAKKIEIELEDGSSLSVRPKDLLLLHPGPLDSLDQLRPLTGDVETAWELLAGATTTLPELADLIYGEDTPAAAWAAWQLVAEALYFTGSPECIDVQPAATVARLRTEREARDAARRAWEAFLERAGAGQYRPEDDPFLAEVAQLARGQVEHSRALRALGRQESPENAHALLLATGYWDQSVDPYPQRLGLPTSPPAAGLPPLADEPRRDLTHLLALAIDDEGNQDPDDALSLEEGRLWVHIADAAALVPPDSAADLEARARAASLYLPEGTVTMLPPAAAARLGLGLSELSPALSFAIDLDAEGQPAGGLEIVPSWVRVQRLTYAQAEVQLGEPPLSQLAALARQSEARRLASGAVTIDLPEARVSVVAGRVTIQPLPSLASRALVREAMLMAGAAVGRFALEQELPLPYTVQPAPEGAAAVAGSPAANGHADGAASLATMFARRLGMKRSQQQSAPEAHAGLGLALYVQCTSPLRRYLDLVVHQQLRAYLRGQTLFDVPALMERVGAAGAVRGSVSRAERLANQHWTLVYLQQQPGWQGQGIVIDRRGQRHLVLIPELALETEIYPRQELPLDSAVDLQLAEVDLPHLTAHFRTR